MLLLMLSCISDVTLRLAKVVLTVNHHLGSIRPRIESVIR